jgi:hypothetical protein
MNPYENCPEFEDDKYLIRLHKKEDLDGLLKVYSDEKSVPFFNSDNCDGDDFHYTTKERMDQAIDYWLFEYERHGFIRFSIIDKRLNDLSRESEDVSGAESTGTAVGTIELFRRTAHDYFDGCGLLRLDLRSDYETEERIYDILSLIVPSTYEMFDCKMIATKIPKAASERRAAASKLGFKSSEEKLVGDDGTEYGDYFVVYA